MRNRYFFLTTILFLLFSNTTFTQTDNKQKAYDLGIQAIKLMDDEGKYDEAIELLEKAKELDPGSIVYPYEIAYALYLKKDYKGSKKIVEELVKREEADAEVFRLLGNDYDFLGEPDKAIEIYSKGLEKYPYEGKLYHELGIVEMNRDNFDAAIEYYEKGVSVHPQYASNYYELTKIFCSSTERIWGITYGEIFMHLEYGSKRTEEISKLLYKTYQDAIEINGNEMHISFTKIPLFDLQKKELAFPSEFEMNFIFATVDVKKVNIKTLWKMRQSFIEVWYKKGSNSKFPNILFDWQRDAIKKGYFEAYNYWMFSKGREKEFKKWADKNPKDFDNFVEWFVNNKIDVNTDNYFLRTKY